METPKATCSQEKQETTATLLLEVTLRTNPTTSNKTNSTSTQLEKTSSATPEEAIKTSCLLRVPSTLAALKISRNSSLRPPRVTSWTRRTSLNSKSKHHPPSPRWRHWLRRVPVPRSSDPALLTRQRVASPTINSPLRLLVNTTSLSSLDLILLTSNNCSIFASQVCSKPSRRTLQLATAKK